MSRRRLALPAVVLTVLPLAFGVATAPAAHATVAYTWTGPDGGLWSDGANWSGGSAPTGFDDVDLTVSGTSVDDMSSLTISRLRLASAAGEVDTVDNLSTSQLDHVSVAAGAVWTLAPLFDLEGQDDDGTTGVEYDDGGHVTFTGSLSGSSGLLNLDDGADQTATTTLAGDGTNNYNGVTEARNGTIELDKPDGVAAAGGNVQGSSFNDTGTVVWLHDHQLNQANEPTIGTQGSGGVLDLNGHDDEAFEVQMADGTIETGAGTLTVDRDISNNNVAGTVRGHLLFPQTGSHRFTDEAADNRLDVTASVDGPLGVSLESDDLGELNLSGGGDFAGTFTLYSGTTTLSGAGLGSAPVVLDNSQGGSPTLNLRAEVASLSGHGGQVGLTTEEPGALTGSGSDVSALTLAVDAASTTGPLLTVAGGPLPGAFANVAQGAAVSDARGTVFANYCDGERKGDLGLDNAAPPSGCAVGTTGGSAKTFTYTDNGNSQDWSDAGNWLGGVAPAAADSGATVVFPAALQGVSSTDDVAGFAPAEVDLDQGGQGASGTSWDLDGVLPVSGSLRIDTGNRPPGESGSNRTPTVDLDAAITGTGAVTYTGAATLAVAPGRNSVSPTASAYSGLTTFRTTGDTTLQSGSVPGSLTVGDDDVQTTQTVATTDVIWGTGHILPQYADVTVAGDGRIDLSENQDTVDELDLTGFLASASGGGLTANVITAVDHPTIQGDLTFDDSTNFALVSFGAGSQLTVDGPIHGDGEVQLGGGDGGSLVLSGAAGDYSGTMTAGKGEELVLQASEPQLVAVADLGGSVTGTSLGQVSKVSGAGTVSGGFTADTLDLGGPVLVDSGQTLGTTDLTLESTSSLDVEDAIGPPQMVVAVAGTASGTFGGLAQGAQTNGTTTSYVSYCGTDGKSADVALTATPVRCGGVEQLSTSTSLAADPTTVAAGGTVELTAQVTSEGPTPGGSVDFTADGTQDLGSVDLSGGVAVLDTAMLAVGQHQVVAEYGGTDAFLGSSSLPVTVTVNPAAGVTLAAGSVVYSRHSVHAAAGLTPDAVWVLAPDGTDTLLEAHARDPRLSADGATLYFRRGTEADGYGDHLWKRVLATGAESDLYATVATVVGYDAVGSSGLILDQSCRLVVVPASGGAATPLGSGSACGTVDPAMNAAGTRVAVQSPAGLVVAATDGSGTRAAVAGTQAGDTSPSWSPDGSTLAFLRVQPGTTTRYDVWTVPAAGGTPTRVTTLVAGDALGPALPWSADGSSVLSAGRVYGVYGLWRIPVAGGAPQLLPTASGDPITWVGAVAGGGSVPAPAPVTTTTSVTPPANAVAGQPVSFTVSVTAGGPVVRGGTVTLTESSAVLGTAPVSDTGTATVTDAAGLGGGAHTVTAAYSGTAVFAASSGQTGFSVGPTAHAVPRVVAAAWTADVASGRSWTPISCAARCTGLVTLSSRGVVVGHATFRLVKRGRLLVTVALTRAGRALLKTHPRWSVRVAVTTRLARHSARTAVRSVVFAKARVVLAPRSAT